MSRRHLVSRANSLIERWRRRGRRLVIAIDGYSGVGKSTLLRDLAVRNPNVTPVFLDDFILPGRTRLRNLQQQTDPSIAFELQWNNIAKLRRLLRQFRTNPGLYRIRTYDPGTDRYTRMTSFDLRKPVLVVEGIFMFHPELLDSEWDRRIYLHLPLAVADRRRIAREKRRWGRAYVSETRPDSFARIFKIAHRRYRRTHNPKRRADVVLRAS